MEGMASMANITNENMMTQAQQIWTMLDEMADNNPQAYKKFIEKQKEENKQWMEPPQPHMCVQTVMYGPKKHRVFINFFGWFRVHGPKDDDTPIPIIGGPLEDDKDEHGPYSVISIGFNPKVLEDFGRDAENPEERKAMVNLAINFVQDRNNMKLSRSYSILKRETMIKGTEERALKALRSVFKSQDSELEHQLEDLKGAFAPMQTLGAEAGTTNGADPKEVPILTRPGAAFERTEPEIKITMDTKPTKTGLIQEISGSTVVLPKPKYTLDVREEDGNEPRRVVMRVELPGVRSVQDCDLDLSEDDLTLFVTNKFELSLQFPEKVEYDETSAKFSKRSSSLTVTIPCVKKS